LSIRYSGFEKPKIEIENKKTVFQSTMDFERIFGLVGFRGYKKGLSICTESPKL